MDRHQRIYLVSLVFLASLVVTGCKPANPTVASSPTVMPSTMLIPSAAPADTPTSAAPRPVPTQPPCPGQGNLPVSTDPLALFLPADSQPVQYAALQFDLSSSAAVQNPFDPAEVDLEVNYTAPDQRQFSIPAFWYQEYNPENTTPCGQPGWKARFTPDLPGQWTAQAELVGQGIKSQPVVFEVATAQSPGFVRLSAENNRYFAFDDGSTFFPIGVNIGWWQTDALGDYARWMDQLQANGGSLIRVWMASWSFGIEWDAGKLGDYTPRLYQAWLLDQIFQMATERGIYIDLVLLNHGAFSVDVNPEWNSNPYNAKNGGPCQNPQCFVTDPIAKGYFERRLRYIAARWGFSTHLFAWEWWNEANLTHITDDKLVTWVKEMTPVLRQYDPYRHLVTISFAGVYAPRVFTLPEIDFAQHHEYSTLDPMENFPHIYNWEKTIYPDKPLMFGEFGYSAAIEDHSSIDRWGIHLHNGLWASTFSGFATTAMYWWWDSYIDPFHLWGQFGSLAHFLEGQDLASLHPTWKAKLSADTAGLMVLQNEDHLLAWVRNNLYDAQLLDPAYQQEVGAQKTPAADWTYTLAPLDGLELSLSGLTDGSYQATWYSPQTGEWLPASTIQVQDGVASLDVPSFSTDLALKVEKIK